MMIVSDAEGRGLRLIYGNILTVASSDRGK